MARGFAYLVAIVDLYSRKVLAWRVSNAMTTDFCVEALQEALRRFGAPELSNTDQGSQFTAEDYTKPLEARGVRISMDGKGRWIDNVMVERLWRSLKYVDVYLRDYGDLHELEQGLTRWLEHYNHERPHQSLAWKTPMEAWSQGVKVPAA